MYQKFGARWTIYLIVLALTLILGGMVRGVAGVDGPPSMIAAHTIGYDVSWPNCAVAVPKDTTWGVVGVTGGLSFRMNPCVSKEVQWFNPVALYVNTGYPGVERAKQFNRSPLTCVADDEQCLAYDYGYNAGVYAVHHASALGLHATWWWLDVETENSWSDSPLVNRASLQGMVAAIPQQTVVAHVGYYAYPGQWDLITGNWRNHLPAWVATGTDSLAAAKLACETPSFTGGPALFAQYTQDLDRNYAC